jgi:hypothetical protein
MRWSDPLYRVRQFWRIVRAEPLIPAEIRRVRELLPDTAFALYQTMPPADQRHSLTIFDALRAAGWDAPPLLQAALLHDIAKRDVGLATRTAVILLKRVSPPLLRRIPSADPHSPRHGFYLSLHHPERGAELARAAGVSAQAVALIRAHQQTNPHFAGQDAAQLCEWLRALQQLDDVN